MFFFMNFNVGWIERRGWCEERMGVMNLFCGLEIDGVMLGRYCNEILLI